MLLKDAFGKVVKNYRPDLRVCREEISVLVELKADPCGIQKSHQRQAQAYLSVAKQDQAVLLINFARNPLEYQDVFRKDIKR